MAKRDAFMGEPEFFERQCGIITFYLNEHRPGRQNLMILHGALGQSSRLRHLVTILDGFNLLFCDLRGHGRSKAPGTGYDPQTMAKDLAEVVSVVFRTTPFSVVGESFSGIIALELSKMCGNLKHITMVDTPFDNGRLYASMVAMLMAYHKAKQQKEAIAGLALEFFGFDVRTHAVKPLSYFRYFTGIKVPILVVTGSIKAVDLPEDADTDTTEPGAYFMKSDIDAIRKYVPPFTCVEIAGAGHSVLKTHPYQFAAILTTCLQKIGSK